MAFVKLDCGILNSTLWVEREPRDVFITALLMAVPFELTEPMPQLKVNAIEETGFVVPPGWYGFIEAAGPGIVRRAIADPVLGMEALAKLGEPDLESRSSDFEGRRLVRVDGGYIVLNFMKYREKDNTSAIRQKRYRDRKKEANLADPTSRASRVTKEQSQRDASYNEDESRRHLSCGVTKADADAEEEKRDTPNPSGLPPSTSPRSSKKCPASFVITPELRQWAREKAPSVNIDAETEVFRDYTFATARTDWPGTWRNWMRKATAAKPGFRPQTGSDDPFEGAH